MSAYPTQFFEIGQQQRESRLVAGVRVAEFARIQMDFRAGTEFLRIQLQAVMHAARYSLTDRTSRSPETS